jgi:uncharacterized membrane protein
MLRSVNQGRLLRHPLHPLIVHLPIGLWGASFVFDWVFLVTRDVSYSRVAYDCLLVGLIASFIAAASGAVELTYVPRETPARRVAMIHLLLSLALWALYVPNWLLRKNFGVGGLEGIPTVGIILSGLGVVLLLVSGYFGGKLVYQYGMGRKPEDRISPSQSDRKAS